METSAGNAAQRICIRCGKPLKKIGIARKNGVQHHGDWWARKLHKACWVAMQPKRRPTGKGRFKFKSFKRRSF